MHVESLEAGHEQPGMKRSFLKSLSKKRARFLFDSVFFFFFFLERVRDVCTIEQIFLRMLIKNFLKSTTDARY